MARPFLLFFIAAAGLSAWYGGWFPGLLSTVLGVLATTYFMVQPRYMPGVRSSPPQVRVVLFAISAVFIVWLIATLKTTQRALQSQRDRFRRAQSSANIAAYDWNIQTGEIVWSEELPILKGLVSDRKTGSWEKFVHPDDLPRLQDAVRRALAKHSEISTDVRIVRPEGTVHWITSRGQIFYDKLGEPAHALGVAVDITDRKAAESRLQAQHAITRALSESPAPATAVPKVLQIFGETLDWDVGQFWALDHVTGELRWTASWSRKSGASFDQESRTLTFPHGEGVPGRAWASAQPVWSEDVTRDPGFSRLQAATRDRLRSALAFPILLGGRVLGVLEFFSRDMRRPDQRILEMAADIGTQIGDFIERRRAQEALRGSEERYRTTLSSIGDAVIATDAMGRIQFINTVAQNLVSCAQQECTGRPLQDIIHLITEDDRQPVANPVGQVMQTGTVVGPSNHTLLLARDGREIPIDHSAAPIRDDQGKIIGIVLVFRDIGARRRTEEALRASEKLAATGRLAASIAHEINNPMESVFNLLYLLENHSTLDETARKYAHLAEQELGRMDKIVKQTLGFYREADVPVPVSIVTVLDNVLELYSRKAAAKRVHVHKEYRFNGEVKAFPGEMRQVFSNLFVNALEAVGEGGTISLHVSRGHDWPDPRRTGVRVTIADNGPGIARENLHHIFEPFFTTKGEKGTGLGLWITYGIVQKHGGRIQVRSSTRSQSRGTCFSVFLPAEAADSESPKSRVIPFPRAA